MPGSGLPWPDVSTPVAVRCWGGSSGWLRASAAPKAKQRARARHLDLCHKGARSKHKAGRELAGLEGHGVGAPCASHALHRRDQAWPWLSQGTRAWEEPPAHTEADTALQEAPGAKLRWQRQSTCPDCFSGAEMQISAPGAAVQCRQMQSQALPGVWGTHYASLHPRAAIPAPLSLSPMLPCQQPAPMPSPGCWGCLEPARSRAKASGLRPSLPPRPAPKAGSLLSCFSAEAGASALFVFKRPLLKNKWAGRGGRLWPTPPGNPNTAPGHGVCGCGGEGGEQPRAWPQPSVRPSPPAQEHQGPGWGAVGRALQPWWG